MSASYFATRMRRWGGSGSLERITGKHRGICSPGRNVLGMMPHPERAAEPELGCIDGFRFLSLVGAMAAK
jgi:phosphoribosylformylglycinamidine synthase